MTLFEFEQMQLGDAVRVTRSRKHKLLRVAGKRGCFLRASDGNEYELCECEPILLTDGQALCKLGFRQQRGLFASDDSYCFGRLDIYAHHINIFVEEKDAMRHSVSVSGYKYLHQAQQKFRELHNEELKLKYDR